MSRTPRKLVICEITKTVEGATCFVVVDNKIYNSIRTCKYLLRNSDMPQNRHYAIIELAETLKIVTEIKKKIQLDKIFLNRDSSNLSKTGDQEQNESKYSNPEISAPPNQAASKKDKHKDNTKQNT